MRRVGYLVGLLCILALIVGLCGCGSGGGSGGTTVGTAGKPPPSPTPTPERIAFENLAGSNRLLGPQIFTMYTNGTGVTQLTFDTKGVNYNNAPSWSGDGTRLCFTSSRNGPHQVFVMNRDGSGQQQVTAPASGMDEFPDWCPADSRIVYHHVDQGGPGPEGLYVVNASGTPAPTMIPGTQHGDSYASWSPTGNSVAFAGLSRTTWGPYVVPASGGTAIPVAQWGAYPDWSPSGTKIAYTEGGYVCYVPVDPAAGAATGPAVRVTTASRTVSHPTWSPDEKTIIFNLYASGSNRAVKVDVTTHQETDLGAGLQPDWSPVLP